MARAFDSDPVAAYLFPDPALRLEGLGRFFLFQLRRNYLSRGEVWVSEEADAGALWLPPDAPGPRLADLLAHAGLFVILGGRLPATRRLARTLAARHPRQPHWYLGTIGTDPPRQRQGVGGALLAPVLARCDRAGTAAYLECSQEANLAFYERQGFAVREEVVLDGGGPRLWLMWRAGGRR